MSLGNSSNFEIFEMDEKTPFNKHFQSRILSTFINTDYYDYPLVQSSGEIEINEELSLKLLYKVKLISYNK